MADRQQDGENAGTDDVRSRQQSARAAQQPPANQGDGMEEGPTDGGTTDGATDGATGGAPRESGRDSSEQSAREGNGGYGNDTGFGGGTVGSRDDVNPYRDDDDRGAGGMR
ncbi:MAG: hypothetical protein ACXWZ4_05900 [Gemmatirosa sp.]